MAEGEDDENQSSSVSDGFDLPDGESDDPLENLILAANGRGHHFIPRAVFRKYDFSDEARRVFESGQTGPLQADIHRWSAQHKVYNDAVGEKLSEFLSKNEIKPESMTRAQAEKFVDDIKTSSDPRIRNFNLKIYMREIMRSIRLIRRPDA